MTSADEAGRTAERVARESYGRLIAFLAARTRDVAGAEDALSEAFAAALRMWPADGVPANPDAWLLTVARRRQTDSIRRRQTRTAGQEHVKMIADEIEAAAEEGQAIPDRRLALMFACAHPAIERGMRAPLILHVPEKEELPERLHAVLDAIYAAYSKGWNEVGDAGTPELADEAIWLARLVVSLMPDEPEANGMLALMFYAEARRAARRDASGAYVPLENQDTTLWDDSRIALAEQLLHEANRGGPTGRYQLEAAIQSAHTARCLTGMSNWAAVVKLYDHLLVLTRSPVVALNRAVTLAEVEGPEAALAAIAPLASDKRMLGYQPYWAARGHLLARTGQQAEAAEAFTVAIGLSTDEAVRAYLQSSLSALPDA